MENKQLNAKAVKNFLSNNAIIILIFILALFVGFVADNFWTTNNFKNLVINVSPRFIIACGVSGCLITKGTDLSAGRQVGLSACLSAMMLQSVDYAARALPWMPDLPWFVALLLVVAIDDAVGLVLFSASFGVAAALESGTISVLTVLVEPVVEIVLSLGLGAVAGWMLFWVEKFFHSRSKRLSISIGFVLLTVGLSMVEFEVGGVHCGFSLLLVCMMTGTIFCNICDFSEELMGRVDGWTAPLFVLFFVLSGAELNLKVLSNPVVLLIGAVYIVFRSLGKCLGAYGSCAMTGCSENITKHLGVTLLPQAGVALGMALTAQRLAEGSVVRNVVLFSVLVYELVGPALTKRALIAAGEIKTEGKTNARKKNAPPKPVRLSE